MCALQRDLRRGNDKTRSRWVIYLTTHQQRMIKSLLMNIPTAIISSILEQTRADSYRMRPKTCTYLTPTAVLRQPCCFGSFFLSFRNSFVTAQGNCPPFPSHTPTHPRISFLPPHPVLLLRNCLLFFFCPTETAYPSSNVGCALYETQQFHQ